MRSNNTISLLSDSAHPGDRSSSIHQETTSLSHKKSGSGETPDQGNQAL